MHNPTDIALLRQWQIHRDALAFRALTQRYGALVFGICNRVLQNAADAEEITQDCFLKLAQDPGKVDRSVGPWLHSVAVNAAISRIRSEQRRRTREAIHEGARAQSTEYAARDLFEHVDEAISQLPDAQRYCVVGYFLEGKPRHDVAAALGVSTKTVQRKTDEAIEKIREILGQRGITTSAGALATTMAGLKVDALPPALAVALGKIAVAGHAGAGLRAVAGKSLISVGGMVLMKKGLVAAGLVLLALVGWWALGLTETEDTTPEVLSQVLVGRTPPVQRGDADESLIHDESVSPGSFERNHGVNVPPSNGQWPDFIMKYQAQAKPLARTASVSGMITDERGRTVAGARVTLFVAGFETRFAAGWDELTHHTVQQRIDAAWQQPGNQYHAVTDEQGTFIISDILHGGANLLKAEAEGYAPQSELIPLESGQTVEANLVLQEGTAIRGTVVTPSKEAIANTTVFPFAFVREDGGSRSDMIAARATQCKTDRKGQFTLWVSDGPWIAAGFLVSSPTHGEKVFSHVALDGTPVTLTVEPCTGALSGHITHPDGTGAGGRAILLRGTIRSTYERDGEPRYSKAEWPLVWGETDANGAYRFDGLPTDASYRATLFDPDGHQEADVALPPLSPDDNTTWNYTLSPPIRVSGVVRGKESGKGLPNVYVAYKKHGTEEDDWRIKGRVPADESGAFEIELLAGAGVYSFQPLYGSNVFAGGGPGIELAPGDVKVLDLSLAEPWTRHFQVIDQFGAPVSGAKIEVVGGVGTPPEQRTDENGMAEVGNLDPRTACSARVELDGFLKHEGDWEMRDHIQKDEPETIVLYRLTSLSARLVDEAGVPTGNRAFICIARFGKGDSETVVGATNQDGWLQLDGNLPAGPVALSFSTDDDDKEQFSCGIDDVDLAVGENGLGTLTWFSYDKENSHGK